MRPAKYSDAANRNPPCAPTVPSKTPPANGPKIRKNELLVISKDMARPIWLRSTTSPIIVRLTGNSLAITIPIRKLPTARCQNSIEPVTARTAQVKAVAAWTIRPLNSKCLRLIRSDKTPRPKPNSIGTKRRKKTKETRKGESVNSKVNNGITRISSHIIELVTQPIDHSLRNCPLFISFGARDGCTFGRPFGVGKVFNSIIEKSVFSQSTRVQNGSRFRTMSKTDSSHGGIE